MTECTFIVTKNNSDYVNWQTDILYKSFLEYHSNIKEFKFLALVAKDRGHITAKYPYLDLKYTMRLKNDHYIVYNRILNLKDYLSMIIPSQDKYIVLLDPDMIFTKQFDFFEHNVLKQNTVVGQGYSYMNNPRAITFFKKHFNKDANIENFYVPIGCPLIISEYLLSVIVDRWLELTVRFRTEDIKGSPFFNNWICEMYGLVFALAEHEIEINKMPICGMLPYVNDYNKGDLYFYHYCYDIWFPGTKKVQFSKRIYKPWNKIDIPYHKDNNKYNVDFLQKMNYYIIRLKKENTNTIFVPTITAC